MRLLLLISLFLAACTPAGTLQVGTPLDASIHAWTDQEIKALVGRQVRLQSDRILLEGDTAWTCTLGKVTEERSDDPKSPLPSGTYLVRALSCAEHERALSLYYRNEKPYVLCGDGLSFPLITGS